jgi:hypothetical protein
VKDLAAKVQWAWEHPGDMEAMGRLARREFETKYTAARNLALLEDIYDFAIGKRGKIAQTAEAQTLPEHFGAVVRMDQQH